MLIFRKAVLKSEPILSSFNFKEVALDSFPEVVGKNYQRATTMVTMHELSHTSL